MTQSNTITIKYVKHIPEKLDSGILYVSTQYGIANHLCACGCGTETVTPLGFNGWILSDIDGLFSLTPSIGNFQYPCKSHYWITNNEIRWA